MRPSTEMKAAWAALSDFAILLFCFAWNAFIQSDFVRYLVTPFPPSRWRLFQSATGRACLDEMLTSIPQLNQLSNFSVNRNTAEGIRQSLYDFQLYPTAGLATFMFFALPLGQGLSTAQGNAGNVKTLADTNMEAAGTLPSPKMFLATSIEFVIFPGSVPTANTYTPQVQHSFVAVPTNAVPISAGSINDINAVIQGGWLNFFIGSKTYLNEAPLLRFPPKTFFNLDAAEATNSATTGTVAMASLKAGGRPYYLDPPVLLMPTQNFLVTVNFPVAIATPSGFNARIGVILDGFLYRNSQ